MLDRTKYQTYQPWKKGIFPQGRCYLRSLLDENNGLRIELLFKDREQSIVMHFNDTEAYRTIDESRRLLQLQHIPSHMIPMKDVVYIVSNSDMVNELVDEACGILQREELVHYLIVTDDACCDVIVTDFRCKEPKLKIAKT